MLKFDVFVVGDNDVARALGESFSSNFKVASYWSFDGVGSVSPDDAPPSLVASVVGCAGDAIRSTIDVEDGEGVGGRGQERHDLVGGSLESIESSNASRYVSCHLRLRRVFGQ